LVLWAQRVWKIEFFGRGSGEVSPRGQFSAPRSGIPNTTEGIFLFERQLSKEERSDGGPDFPAGWSGSISHTDGFVGAIVASGTAIGFDLEHRWHKFPETVNYAHRNPCHDSARDQFLRRWVVGEAVAKAAGVPLSDVLSVYATDERVCLQVPWFTCTLTVGDDFMACVATSEPTPEPSLVWLAKHQMVDFLAG
jgi:4'-phosphopantetheinyl transferase N-terminal domain